METSIVEQQPTPELIVAGARVLAGVCDGAVAEDGCGYNGVDSRFMKSLASQVNHTPRQLRAMWNCLRKYRGQLSGYGIEYDEMVPPVLPGRNASGQFTKPENVVKSVKLEWVDTPFGRKVAVIFAYDPGIIAEIKMLKKAPKAPPWFDGARKCWLIPDDDLDMLDDVVAIFEKRTVYSIELSDEVSENAKATREARLNSYKESRASSAELDVPTKLPLRPFQKAGVKWAIDHDGRILLGDDMGIGKTAQVLGFWTLKSDALPALVLCPAHLRVNWYREVEKFTELKSQIICSKTGLKGLIKLGLNAALAPEPGYDIYIVNYDLLSTETPATWVRNLKRGDASKSAKLLEEAGLYALSAIQKGFRNCTGESHARLNRVFRKIRDQGDSANRRRFIKVSINGTPMEEFTRIGFNSLACDESHYVKEGKSQRTMAVMELSKLVKNSICMTGTTLLNRPKELWTQTQIVNPKLFPNFMSYAKEYCAASQTTYGWDFSGSSNLEKLDRVLRENIMIRRTKSQVLTELPPKTRITIPIALDARKYKKEAAEAIAHLAELKEKRETWKSKMSELDDEKRAKYLADHAAKASDAAGLVGHMMDEIEKIKQAALHAKFDDCVKFAIDAQAQQGKLIIFATHHETIDRTVKALREEGLEVDHIDGRVPAHRREEVKERFQDGSLQVLVGGIRAMAEGLTLTASHTVIFFEFDWNPGKHQQAEDRVHRIGQEVSPTIYYLVAVGTIEEQIVALIDAKLEVVNAAVGEGDRTLNEGGILDAILTEVL